MKAYKGFNPDMTCRGFQYKEVRALEVDGVNIMPGVWYMLKEGEVIEV